MENNPVLIEYLPVAVLVGIALFFAVLLPVLSLNLGPKPKESARSKYLPYESGIVAIGEAQRRLPVKFYR
ncbi:MAG: NADH-quinone oxidoreductase subunit A, partial [Anaerolineales bacterium]|nr:NADH-quinone oxidoreductase subunit A [Anaerolineales bacterium]